jgi:hypothetical protein
MKVQIPGVVFEVRETVEKRNVTFDFFDPDRVAISFSFIVTLKEGETVKPGEKVILTVEKA